MGKPVRHRRRIVILGAGFADTGREEAAAAEAYLLAPDGPHFTLHSPSAESLRGKQKFEEEKLQQWFGI